MLSTLHILLNVDCIFLFFNMCIIFFDANNISSLSNETSFSLDIL